MLIPSIDLQDGKIVQLVQGERLAIEDEDVFAWVRRFERFPKVQLIDLDAARRRGRNLELVRSICARLPCRVGGGIRSIAAGREAIEGGAAQVIVGSAFFRDGRPDLRFAEELAGSIGLDRIIAAIDGRGGQVVVDGWRTTLPIAPADAALALEPYCSEFLYTHVDTEGLMHGIDMAAVSVVRGATGRRLSVAGGIVSEREIDELEAMRVDAVVGMAIYTGMLKDSGLRIRD
jgi:phosphoribosylformimino-5-aminoimidazole carboxamide ribotide isomerase